jgi:hypothetical protein
MTSFQFERAGKRWRKIAWRSSQLFYAAPSVFFYLNHLSGYKQSLSLGNTDKVLLSLPFQRTILSYRLCSIYPPCSRATLVVVITAFWGERELTEAFSLPISFFPRGCFKFGKSWQTWRTFPMQKSARSLQNFSISANSIPPP